MLFVNICRNDSASLEDCYRDRSSVPNDRTGEHLTSFGEAVREIPPLALEKVNGGRVQGQCLDFECGLRFLVAVISFLFTLLHGEALF